MSGPRALLDTTVFCGALVKIAKNLYLKFIANFKFIIYNNYIL